MFKVRIHDAVIMFYSKLILVIRLIDAIIKEMV